MEPIEPPPKLPPWVKKEILLPVAGVLFIGLIFGNYLVYRAIKQEAQYQTDQLGPMDRAPLPGNLPLGQRIVDTGRTLSETNGVVTFGAEQFTRMTGAWTTLNEDGRTIVRMTNADAGSAASGQMYLSYRIQFQTAGRYRLRAMARGSDAEPRAILNVFWNREPNANALADFSLAVSSSEFAWTTDISGTATKPDFATNGLPVSAPGFYTLFLVQEHVPDTETDSPNSATQSIAIDALELKRVEEDASN